ncbi:protein kinase C and casein kinase substrate in neurons protein 1 isoform X1 [Gadus morhua]|uniref:Protein kinase C and casein kinase substrate in neurons 1b n=1 Tax=Gadus morhua TaxID=8049 RepID=A0A8C5CUB7_GADMO|nr:protein kinase C and casein kinase substrate in neurons protein 1-like isoform X1 [Gadus morhua]XP_030231373.1 protein kinase C and casein kinase substrate in neurons protein 1-like isoform X1 [Gadus morhua]XP_030231374.1 protein kinase C and casein kinase substrate in neurons protein 1-like isoform X1 [Gadus morhua]
MSGGYDDTASQEEGSSDSFWEVGNYKRTVKRTDDGHRLCNDLMNCVQERAKIEKAYSTQLTDWSKRWRQLVDKGPQYGTVERAWTALMVEAEKVSELHQDIRNRLMSEDFEKVKTWQKDSYHKQMMGGFKESKETDEGFKKAQKPWAKRLKELEAAKKNYHAACKEEKLASSREANGKADAATNADQLKKLTEKMEKCKQDSQKAREKYEKSLEELNSVTSQYMENMEQVFEQSQQFEEKRLSFIREVLLDVKRHLNLTENQSYATVYRDLEQVVTSASPQEDLKWFNAAHGPGMAMSWPQFEEYNHEATHNISRREKSRKNHDGVTLTHMTPATDSPQGGGDQASLSSSDKTQARPNSEEWSDEEQGDPDSGGQSNGGPNPFEEEPEKGVRVKALYDYDGQEQDELTFKAGDELTKLEDEDEQGWCQGRLDDGQLGLYPANYVEPV